MYLRLGHFVCLGHRCRKRLGTGMIPRPFTPYMTASLCRSRFALLFLSNQAFFPDITRNRMAMALYLLCFMHVRYSENHSNSARRRGLTFETRNNGMLMSKHQYLKILPLRSGLTVERVQLDLGTFTLCRLYRRRRRS